MTLQLSSAVRTARLVPIETTIGGTAIMQLLTGSMPANCAAASTGGTVATLTLPADYLDTPVGGTVGKNGTWQDTSADAAGTVGYFRIWNNALSSCHIQGTCTNTSGGGDLELQNVIINAGQSITISSFVLTDGNA